MSRFGVFKLQFSSLLPSPSAIRRRNVAIAVFATVFTLLLLRLVVPSVVSRLFPAPRYYKYRHKTPSFFPPSNHSVTDYCAGFPSSLLEDVQVVVKTGIGELEKAISNLRTTSSCLHNVIVISDAEYEVDGHQSIDILADLPPSYRNDNPDFEIYSSQNAAILEGNTVPPTHEAWKLDRFKFLPMVDRTYQMRPHARWYVFIEADVYVFWDTMFRLLHQLDPVKRYFMGSVIPGSYNRDFPYGGGGIVISNGLMMNLTASGIPLATQYEDWVKDDCCGDAVLAYAIFNRTGVRAQGLYPMFSGDDVEALNLNEETWCTPMITLHRMNPDKMDRIWRWERTRPYTENPLVYSDTLYYTHPNLQDEPTKPSWDNLSNDKPPHGRAHHSLLECAKACYADTRCLQYAYNNGQCRLSRRIMLGHATDDRDDKLTSGWQTERIIALGHPTIEGKTWGCHEPLWTRSNTHLSRSA